MAGNRRTSGHALGLQPAVAQAPPGPVEPPSAKPADVRVADDQKVLAAAERIAERDRELLKRLAR